MSYDQIEFNDYVGVIGVKNVILTKTLRGHLGSWGSKVLNNKYIFQKILSSRCKVARGCNLDRWIHTNISNITMVVLTSKVKVHRSKVKS